MDKPAENDTPVRISGTSANVTAAGEWVSLHVTRKARALGKELAEYYGTPMNTVVETSLHLLKERIEGTDQIQVAELMTSIYDLHDSVKALLMQAEILEQLAVELIAIEIARTEE
jgi:hypothetical protein